MVNLLPKDGIVVLYNNFLSDREATHYLKQLTNNIPWRQDSIKVFGKIHKQPRLTSWHAEAGKNLRYSNITMNALPFTKELQEINHRLTNFLKTPFNGVLLNLYRNGEDAMGWHKDNEAELGKEPTIASISLGATRDFQFRHDTDKTNRVNIKLTHGSLVVMSEKTTERWYHQLPRRKRVKDPRINLTYRFLI